MSNVWNDDRPAHGPPPRPPGERALGGALTGLAAGALLALVATCQSAWLGLGFWTPLKVVAASATGLPALIGDGATVAAGFGIHEAVAAAWGVGFGLLVPRRPNPAVALLLGFAWGALAWLVTTWVVLPYANDVQLARVHLIPWSWLSYHLVFGVLLSAAPWLAPRRRRAPARAHGLHHAPLP